MSQEKGSNFIFKLLIFLNTAVRFVLSVVFLCFFITFLSQFIEQVDRYSLLSMVVNATKDYSTPLINLLQQAIPYRFWDVNFSFLYLSIVCLMLKSASSNLQDRISSRRYINEQKQKYTQFRKSLQGHVPNKKAEELDETFEEMVHAKGSDKKKIVEKYIQLKKYLDNMGRNLAFLSIDVVDSTGMKRDEDKHIASHDFDAYNKLVIDVLKAHEVLKYTLTPDGMMCCFANIDKAVEAAKNLLEKLEYFNIHEKQIKRDFHIRCGINAGLVYMDDETPLEEISDRVIDIAGHMQKHAKPDTINIAELAIKPLEQTEGFLETKDIIDEQRVFEWTKDK